MSDLFPLQIARAVGAPETGEARRIPASQFEAYLNLLLQWVPQDGILVKGPAGLLTPTLEAGQAMGRREDGTFGGLDSSDFDAILNLPSRLGGRAPLVHTHGFQAAISDIDWSTLAQNRILAYVGGQFLWIDAPSGGGLGNPLTADLDLATFALVSGAEELVRFVEGELRICGLPFPKFAGDPQVGDVWRFGPGGEWEPTALTAAMISVAAAGMGGTVEAAIGTLAGQIAARAPLAHTHDITQVGGGTEGNWVRFGPGGTLIEVPPPGGLGNPLTTDLNLGGLKIVDGATDIIQVVGGQLLIAGQPVMETEFGGLAAGDVVRWDPVNERWVNGPLPAEEVTVSTAAVDATDVEGAIDELATGLEGKADAGHGHAVTELTGTTAGLLLRVSDEAGNPVEEYQIQAVDIPVDRGGGQIDNVENIIQLILQSLGNKQNRINGTPDKILQFDAGGVLQETDLAIRKDGGNVFIDGLPKVDPAVDGALWADGDTIRISPGNV